MMDALRASLADTLMPDAYREGGKLIAFATAAAGFFVSFVISELYPKPAQPGAPSSS